MSPLLVILGYDAKLIVPAILVSEMISGVWGGFWHWRFKNVDWKAVGLTLLGSLAAMGLATYVMYAFLPPAALKMVVSMFAVIMGVFVVIRSYMINRLARIKVEKHKWLLTVMGFLIGYQKGTCYDEKTEILTKSGWKLFKDLALTDEVACLSKGGHEFYWHKPTAIQRFAYRGKMIKIAHRSVDLLVTPNHNMYVRGPNGKEYGVVQASQLTKSVYSTINKVQWIGQEKEFFELPKVAYLKQSNGQHIEKTKIKMDHWLRFLGWFISEGSIVQNHKDYIVCIQQRKKENILEIKQCLDAIEYNWNYQEKTGHFRIYNKQLYAYLKQFGGAIDKHIPDEFMDLSKRQLQIIFDSLMKGDGHIVNNRPRSFYTSSNKLADQVQELAMKLGYNSSIKTRDRIGETHLIRGKPAETKNIAYEVAMRISKETYFVPKNAVTNQEYDGMVYCCTVPEHVMLVRRNGYSTWCNNSGGNYGPFSVTGYMVMGYSAAVAIGTTTIAEGIACALGVAMYSQLTGIVLLIAAPLAIGAFIADPISAWINNRLKKKLSPPFHGRLIGLAMTLIGLIALAKTLGLLQV